MSTEGGESGGASGRAEASEKPVVLFILGWGRSGSTLLDTTMGSVWPAAFSCGELMYLPDRGLVEQRLCGCGTPVPRCGVWTDILERSGVAAAPDWPQRMTALRRRLCSYPAVIRGAAGLDPVDHEATAAPYGRAYAPVYRAIAESTGARVLIDSSKHPMHALACATSDDIVPVFLHLVRHPNAVAHSLRRRKGMQDGSGTEQVRRGPVRSAITWQLFNRATRNLFAGDPRYILTRYEDFVRCPDHELNRAGRSCDPTGRWLADRPAGSTLERTVSHTVSGNPGRFQTGPLTLREDRGWQSEQSRVVRWTVAALSLPESRRYYPHTADPRSGPCDADASHDEL